MYICVSPSHEEGLTGLVYVNPTDARSPYVIIKDRWVYRCAPHADVKRGHIAMNLVQRRQIKENEFGTDIEVRDFYVPMNREFGLSSLTLVVDFLYKQTDLPMPDLASVANAFRTHYEGHVLQTDQVLLLYFNDQMLRLTVTSVSLGLVTHKTEIGIQRN
jgi:hypothetical protein